MLPISLTLVNCCQHAKIELDYTFGLTGIVGHNGCGKSNLITTAQFFAITGKTPPEVNKSELLKWGAMTGKTIFEFLLPGSDTVYTLERNLHNSGVKLSSDNEGFDPIRGAEASRQMEAWLGRSFDVFWETCWIPQGTLTKILTCRHSDRVAFFQKIAGAKEAEIIRAHIQEKGVNQLPLYPDRQEELDEQRKIMDDCRLELAQIEEDKKTVDGLYEEFKELSADAAAILALPSEEDRKKQIQRAEEALKAAITNLDTYVENNSLDMPKDPGTVSEEDEATFKAIQAFNAKHEEHTATFEEAVKDLRALTKSEPEDPGGDEDEVYQEHRAANNRLKEVSDAVRLLKEGTCPTCKKECLPEDYGMTLEEAEAEKAELDKKIAELEDLGSQMKDYQRELNTWKTKVEIQKKRVSELEENMPTWADSWDGFDVEAFSDKLEAVAEYNKAMRRRQEGAELLKKHEALVEKRKAELEVVKDKPYATAERIAEARDFTDKYEELVNNRTEFAKKLGEIGTRLEEVEKTNRKYAEEQEKGKAVNELKALFEEAREVLHRDQLPSLVLQRMRVGLNNLMDNYLSLFDTNFTAYLNEEFDFMCDFPDKDEVPARMLSGGQSVALAIAFRFAISDMFANEIPILSLDEPTVYLDDTNIKKVAEVLEKVKEITSHGVCVMIATHEEALMSSFSRTVSVSD